MCLVAGGGRGVVEYNGNDDNKSLVTYCGNKELGFLLIEKEVINKKGEATIKSLVLLLDWN